MSEPGAASDADEPADEAPAEVKADAAKADAVPEAGALPMRANPLTKCPLRPRLTTRRPTPSPMRTKPQVKTPARAMPTST